MKKFRYIIATVFVVAIGAGIFWACEKEEATSNTSVTKESNKIQKRPQGITYVIDEIREINGKCYHVIGTYFEWTDINDIRRGECDGVIYTEVDCYSYLAQEASTVEFSYNPILDCNFSTVAQYTNTANYTFTVTVGETLSPELLYLFEQDALICMCGFMF
jgi:hypothetical protein